MKTVKKVSKKVIGTLAKSGKKPVTAKNAAEKKPVTAKNAAEKKPVTAKNAAEKIEKKVSPLNTFAKLLAKELKIAFVDGYSLRVLCEVGESAGIKVWPSMAQADCKSDRNKFYSAIANAIGEKSISSLINEVRKTGKKLPAIYYTKDNHYLPDSPNLWWSKNVIVSKDKTWILASDDRLLFNLNNCFQV